MSLLGSNYLDQLVKKFEDSDHDESKIRKTKKIVQQ